MMTHLHVTVEEKIEGFFFSKKKNLYVIFNQIILCIAMSERSIRWR